MPMKQRKASPGVQTIGSPLGVNPAPDGRQRRIPAPALPRGRQQAGFGLWSCCRARWEGRAMEKRNIYIIVAVVFVLVILGYAFGWFDGSAPPPTATTPATPAPAAPAQ